MVAMEIPENIITSVLDSILWTVNPYIDAPDYHHTIHEYPWIVELIKSYNDIYSILPPDLLYQYKYISL